MSEEPAPAADAKGWPHARRFSLLSGKPAAPGEAARWILLIQTDQGMSRFDIHDAALDELIEAARAARAGDRLRGPQIDAATGAACPWQAEG
jgi:hypothetical protein